MNADLEVALIDSLVNDDVEAFVVMVKKWDMDVHKVYEVENTWDDDYEFTALTWAVTMNAVTIVSHLMAQGVHLSTRCFRPYDVLRHEEDSHGREIISEDRCQKPFTALNLATSYMDDSHMAQLLRGEYHDNVGLTLFTFARCAVIRSSYPAAKRAKKQYESECM